MEVNRKGVSTPKEPAAAINQTRHATRPAGFGFRTLRVNMRIV